MLEGRSACMALARHVVAVCFLHSYAPPLYDMSVRSSAILCQKGMMMLRDAGRERTKHGGKRGGGSLTMFSRMSRS